MAEDTGRVEGPIDAGSLRKVASLLDLYDRLAVLIVEAIGHERAASLGLPEVERTIRELRSTDIQDDLRRWAYEMDTSDYAPSEASDG